MKYLSISYKIAKAPSKCRVFIWRKLKGLGVAMLSQGTAVLPNRANYLQELLALQEEIEKYGGVATISTLVFPNEKDEQYVESEFGRLRDEEYIELGKECAKLIFEISWLMENNQYRFSELEENEEEYKKLCSWYHKIESRDFSRQLASGKETRAALARANAKIREYAAHVYQLEKYK